ncbi:MAG: hypothetical protein D6735_08720 [Acidobacteria bacterium]|nr:MAG: hypothetical protein D6735_08720 [Acidobacteriota bacterium]
MVSTRRSIPSLHFFNYTRQLASHICSLQNSARKKLGGRRRKLREGKTWVGNESQRRFVFGKRDFR